ncbi:ABC transporter substrate-binding protein [Paenibacillus glycanilyticus]|uniref:ABC transporter extracellular-binding protein YurO n=1 Tax=Paenibacillus glycanilyticus TaxID=126569 RepID=A0ABQ6G6I6_9BACL|nr:extracellular solute-binding protein [Paenibacillus glycanilyticus]GLX66060.1 putative ABC transporter extracellular-binding protein YurO [Paenibacillus glycanilyticus]
MKTNKLIGGLLTLSLAGSLLAGCGSSNNGEPAANGGASSDSGAKGKTKITFWKWIPTEGQMPELEAAFEKENPDIDLEVTHVGESGAYFQKLSAGLAGGEGPDVIAMQVGANANQYKEFLEPLAPYAEKEWGADWKSNFLDVALEQAAYSGDDFRVLPGGMTATPVILYNATMFEKYGLQVPKTLDELNNVIQVLKEKEPGVIPGVGIGAKDGWTDRDVFMGIVNEIAPGKVYDAQEGKIPWTDPDIVKAFQVWGDLFKNGVFSDGAMGQSPYPNVSDSFTKGKSSMFSIGTWHLSGFTKVAHDQMVKDKTITEDTHWGMFPFPNLSGGKQNMVATVDIAWGMNADSKHKDAVWKFIKFMAAGEGQKLWTNTLQVLPSQKGVQVTAEMAGKTEEQSLQTVTDFMSNNISGARELKYPELQNALFDALQAVALGGKTPEKVAEDIEAVSKTVQR